MLTKGARVCLPREAARSTAPNRSSVCGWEGEKNHNRTGGQVLAFPRPGKAPTRQDFFPHRGEATGTHLYEYGASGARCTVLLCAKRRRRACSISCGTSSSPPSFYLEFLLFVLGKGECLCFWDDVPMLVVEVCNACRARWTNARILGQESRTRVVSSRHAGPPDARQARSR